MNSQDWSRTQWTAILLALASLILLVHGYHPLSEDGGLYAAGIYLKLDPALFPSYREFVRVPMLYSHFAGVMALLVHASHLSVPWLLFLIYLATTWLTLFAARQVLRRCTRSGAEQVGGVALLAAWWTLPIAGTSLVLMDPYVTARSFSTPLTLLALAFATDDWNTRETCRSWGKHPAIRCALCLALAGTMHLLMAAYALAFVVSLRASMAKKPTVGLFALAVAAIGAAALLQIAAPHESNAWSAAEISRYYWFLSQWHWFEIAGLVGPMAVLALIDRRTHGPGSERVRGLCRCTIALGCIALVVALLFAHENSSVHLVARLQPLRVYLPVYALMAMLLGGALVRASGWAASQASPGFLRGNLRRAPVWIILCMAVGMHAAQRDLYPRSPNVELPWRMEQTSNPWVQAFLWARANTSSDNLFALDAHYVTISGEDAQTFRATSLRDALPDYSKDGGEAAIEGELAPAWAAGAEAQLNLDKENDAERAQHLLPFGVSWLILRSSSSTAYGCPYDNGTVKVCKLKEIR